ncbi:O(6)-methylguanine-induced apoptosis 2 isoform X2 [Esox lucius]|uniref:O(6)-methylguanine-induced apoptosis 2 isoform X2 n=1 Tax=Esox lucius TaxID=8010 RepID=UPI001476FBFD|nr:O(6)-methylguanine-induced apoptosis 2 isoform X2 [Esox lucius]
MGKIHRGLNNRRQHAGNISSIPTKYQTVVISNEDKKGFLSQAKRFIAEDSQNENPGPGTYISHSLAEIRSPSFSKKGTGGLASQAVRVLSNAKRGIPGPNEYNLQSSLIHKHSFGRGGSRTFQLPIAVQPKVPKNKTPAPNQYHVSLSGIKPNTLVSARSVFLSRTGRCSVYSNTPKGPSPCHYKVNDAITQKCPKVPFSCFKSNSARIQSPVINHSPGPGTYSPYQAPEPVRRSVLPKPILGHGPPRTLPKDPLLPGPGQYNVVDYGGLSKHFMSSAAFFSRTSRWNQDVRGQGMPGPGHYEPDMSSSKQSFLHNHSKNWIPA